MSVIANTKMRVSDEQSMLLDVAREFCRDKSPIDRVRAELETETGFDAAVWQEMVNLGWTGIALPESAGGSGLGIGAVVPVVESMGRAMLGTPLISTTLAGQLIVRAGGEEMWGDLVAQVAAGSVATIALLDSADWGETRITCELDSDNRLSGTKTFVADAGVAEHLLVVAQRGGEPVVVHLTADRSGPAGTGARWGLVPRSRWAGPAQEYPAAACARCVSPPRCRRNRSDEGHLSGLSTQR